MCELHGIRDAFVGDLVYACSRCRSCYVCEHEAHWDAQLERWMWLCRDGQWRECIRDGGVF